LYQHDGLGLGGKTQETRGFCSDVYRGTTARIVIDSAQLLRGDQVAYTIAAERKQAGLLPHKQIKSIRRVQAV
jgi:hypothetical protein